MQKGLLFNTLEYFRYVKTYVGISTQYIFLVYELMDQFITNETIGSMNIGKLEHRLISGAKTGDKK